MLAPSEGSSYVQLLEPLSDDTPVGRFLARRGEGIHHVGYAVPDVVAALETIGIVGVVLAMVLLALSGVIGHGGHVKKKESAMARWRALLTSRPVMLFFVFYVGSAAANSGV